MRQAGGELPEARELVDMGEADRDVGLALAVLWAVDRWVERD